VLIVRSMLPCVKARSSAVSSEEVTHEQGSMELVADAVRASTPPHGREFADEEMLVLVDDVAPVLAAGDVTDPLIGAQLIHRAVRDAGMSFSVCNGTTLVFFASLWRGTAVRNFQAAGRASAPSCLGILEEALLLFVEERAGLQLLDDAVLSFVDDRAGTPMHAAMLLSFVDDRGGTPMLAAMLLSLVDDRAGTPMLAAVLLSFVHERTGLEMCVAVPLSVVGVRLLATGDGSKNNPRDAAALSDRGLSHAFVSSCAKVLGWGKLLR